MDVFSIALAVGGWACLAIAARAAVADLAAAVNLAQGDDFDSSVARWGYVGEGWR